MLITVQPRPFVVALGFQMKKSYEKLLPLLSLVFLEGVLFSENFHSEVLIFYAHHSLTLPIVLGYFLNYVLRYIFPPITWKVPLFVPLTFFLLYRQTSAYSPSFLVWGLWSIISA